MTSLRVLRDELDALERAVVAAGAAHDPLLTQVDPQYRDSARNFVDYVGLRQHDLRPLQRELWAHGLSSLGRLEGHVRDAIGQVLGDDTLAQIARQAGVSESEAGAGLAQLLPDVIDRVTPDGQAPDLDQLVASVADLTRQLGGG